MTFGHDRTQHTYDALSALRADLAHLQDLRGTGPIRRRPGWGPSPDQIAANGRRHAAERADAITQIRAGLAPIGSSPSPADLTVLDVLRDVRLDLADLLDACIERVSPQMRPAHTDARRIGQIINLLPKIGAVSDLLDHVIAETRRMHRAVKHALGDAEPSVRITTPCPHCNQMSVRSIPGRLVVACFYSLCQCQDPACRCQRQPRPGSHQWTDTEWKDAVHGITA